MAIKAPFEQEDAWEEFLERTNPNKKVQKACEAYAWTYGRDEDDEGMTRECVILEVPVKRETEPRNVEAKLTSRHLTLRVHKEEVINDDFCNDRWLSVEDSYWEFELKTDKKSGQRRKNIRYLLYMRADCPQYLSGPLFENERRQQEDEGTAQQEDDDCDTADARIRAVADMKEPEPRRDEDVYFSEDDEFSEPECDGCGSKTVQVMKKAEDREFKVYCSDCPYVSVANMQKEARSIRRQREVDEAREKKRKEKEKKRLAEKLAIQDAPPATELAQLEEVD